MNNKSYFGTDFNRICLTVVRTEFPLLVENHILLLANYLYGVCEFIPLRFCFSTEMKESAMGQFTQNNNRDLVGLLMILLPFIKDYEVNKKRLRRLDDLYVEKMEDCDISTSAPNYRYCNTQYGRCNRTTRSEIQWSPDFLHDNYVLLLETIRSVSNKLYVNWINVRPFREDYWNSLLFTESVTMVKEGRDRHGRGLDWGDVYGSMRNFVYGDVLNIRWIIYDLWEEGRGVKFLSVLRRLLPLDECVRGDDWNGEKMELFTHSWDQLVSGFIRGEEVRGVSVSNVNLIVGALISYGKYSFTVGGKYNKSLMDLLGDGIDFDETSRWEGKGNVTIDAIKKFIVDVDSRQIYDYLGECVEKLAKCWWGKFYLVYEGGWKLSGVDSSLVVDNMGGGDGVGVGDGSDTTLKCIYNFAKSLCHDGEFLLYPAQWRSMSSSERDVIVKRLSDKGVGGGDWFRIGGILKRRGVTGDDVGRIERKVFSYLKKNIVRVVFDVLIQHGLLSELVFDSELSNDRYLPVDTMKRIQMVQEKVWEKVLGQYEGANYFIDNLTYGHHENYFNDMRVGRVGSWITTYAMDYVSQISTFHRYLNNRVVYVTGGTGVGKSTQIPKLLLYAMKMCDYKINGRVGCTAPRKNAVKTNAETISAQMGIPIVGEKGEELPNYHIQFKYKKSADTRIHGSNIFGLRLEILTDAIMDIGLTNNPLLKFGNMNVYDIVIVDEAHEHNVNMDLILTKMRYGGYFNNDLKLFIMSATMDEDEPIYRRYYRSVNDNRMYPPCVWNEEMGVDRINVDRRMHVSPPGMVTQFEIVETYVEGGVGEDAVIDVLNKFSEGDVLLFKPGMNEILKAVKYINERTGGDVIAIPYYSTLSTFAREFVEKIDKNMDKFFFTKENATDLEKMDEEEGKKGRGRFRRVVIVATDIAEASITLSTLQHVVDTGTQKVKMFSEYVRSEVLELKTISNSSRVQRAGRVGRVGKGWVTYMYKKGLVDNIRRPYKIAISNLKDNLFEMLDDGEKKFLISKEDDFNRLGVKGVSKGLDKNLYENVVKGQYYVGLGLGKFFTYHGKVGMGASGRDGMGSVYDYENDERDVIYCYTHGWDMDTLFDYYGKFYIVHPNELELTRNLFGEIVSDTGKMVKYHSTKIDVFFEMLMENLLIIYNGGRVYKTKFGLMIGELVKKVVGIYDVDKESANYVIEFVNYIIPYVYSLKYGCGDDMLKIIVCYLVNGSLEELVSDWGRGKLLYSNRVGDSVTILKIVNDVIDMMGKRLSTDEMKYLCKERYVKFSGCVSMWRLLGVLKRVVNKLNIDLDVVPMMVSDWEGMALSDRLKVCLIQSYPDNLLWKLYGKWFINMMNPSAKNVFTIPMLKKNDKYECTMLEPMGRSVILRVGKGDVLWLENIDVRLVAKVLSFQVFRMLSVRWDVRVIEREVREMVKVGMGMINGDEEGGGDDILTIDGINNYVKTRVDIREMLTRYYDRQILNRFIINDKGVRIGDIFIERATHINHTRPHHG